MYATKGGHSPANWGVIALTPVKELYKHNSLYLLLQNFKLYKQMKKLIIVSLLLFLGLPGLFAQTKAGKKETLQHTTLYSCPTHSDVTSNKPGKFPQCGMALISTSKEQMKTTVMKNYTCPVHLDITKHDPGKCPICGKKLSLSSKEQMKTEVMKIYTCPMHPEIALDKDGKCPKCGAALVEKKQG